MRSLIAAAIAAALVTPVAFGAGGNDYKPIHISGAWTPGIASALYSDNGGCAVYQPLADSRLAALDSSLTVAWEGTAKPSSADLGQTQTYNLKGTVTGYLTDAVGNAFNVSGMFFDRTTATNRVDLLVDGTGRITLSGPAGTISGDAALRVVTAPNELQLQFVSVKTCAPA